MPDPTLVIRDAEPRDHATIDTLVRRAFETAPVSDGAEHHLVRRLRGSAGFVPGLELVAERDGVLVGHILVTRITIEADAAPVDALEVAPLSVAVDHRAQGIGARLMDAAHHRARERGYPAVFLVGDPGYYGRFGYRAVADLGLRNATDVPDDVVLGLALRPGVLGPGAVRLA